MMESCFGWKNMVNKGKKVLRCDLKKISAFLLKMCLRTLPRHSLVVKARETLATKMSFF